VASSSDERGQTASRARRPVARGRSRCLRGTADEKGCDVLRGQVRVLRGGPWPGAGAWDGSAEREDHDRYAQDEYRTNAHAYGRAGSVQ
jgi:hypothetical protein